MQNSQGEPVVKYLDFRFNRVYEGKEIIRILGSVADTTDAVRLQERLQQEREQSDTQLQMLGSLVSADPSVMNDFIEKVFPGTGRSQNTFENIMIWIFNIQLIFIQFW